MKSIFQQFTGREHSPLVQFIKYGIAGAAATAVHTVAFFLAAWLAFPALGVDDPLVRLLGVQPPAVVEALRARNAALDNLIAFLFSNAVAYAINVLWVFEGGRHHRLVEIGMFVGVSAISMVAGTFLQSILIYKYGMATTFAFVANIVTAMLINYAMRKFVIFKG